MAAPISLLSEKQFLCSICLDVFTDPVTIPCGHNFCKNCITQAWDKNVKKQCPMCKELFIKRPDLRVNTFICEMVDQFRKSTQKTASSSEQKQARAGDVPCGICTETKLKALKSCLVCLTSYCEAHLELHQKITSMARHELTDPEENLEGRVCKKHATPLELFCETDQMFVCRLCKGVDHKRHRISPLRKEYEQKKAALERNDAELQQMIQERRLKIQELSVELSRDDADREAEESVQVFIALIQSVERGLAQLIDVIQEKQKQQEKQTEVFIKDLEREISELMKRSAEVEQLLCTEDHLQFLQSFLSLNPAPPAKDWTEVKVRSSHELWGAVRGIVAQLEKTLSKEMKKLCADVELKRVQQYAVDVTLDPGTAHPALILSENKKQVSCGDVKKSLPDNPERFSLTPCVLGEQSFCSGRYYYEVQVRGKSKWDLGVARESVNRKGLIAASPSTGLWVVWLKNGNEYRALDEPGVPISLKSELQKVGVFVDYEEGRVSFYDVDAAALIYSFTGCNFTEKLYPFFGPCTNDGGRNSAPLIISPVNHTD